jgi:uncharacterized protein YbcI
MVLIRATLGCSSSARRVLPKLLLPPERHHRFGGAFTEEDRPTSDVDDRAARGTVSAGISNAVVKLMSEYTGRGPTTSRTAIDRDVVTVVLGDSMTKGERSLVASGETELVLAMRQEFQRAMRNDLVAAVEGAMGRKVIAFMSANHIEPDMAAEVFVLEAEARQPAEEEAPDSSAWAVCCSSTASVSRKSFGLSGSWPLPLRCPDGWSARISWSDWRVPAAPYKDRSGLRTPHAPDARCSLRGASG